MKELKVALKSVSESLRGLSQEVEVIVKKLENGVTEDKAAAKPKRKPAAKKKAASKKSKQTTATKTKKAPSSKKPTAADKVQAVINRAKKGVDVATLVKKTGFNKKQVANNIYKLKKAGKIQSVSKGVYTKV